MSFTKLKVLYLVIMFFTVKLRLVQQRLYKKKKDSEILRVNNQIVLYCFFPLSSRDIFSWNVNMYKRFRGNFNSAIARLQPLQKKYQ